METSMKRRTLVQGAATAVATAALPAGHAQQAFRLTIASSHPTTLPWVGLMSTLFVPEVNKRVEALGKGLKIEWREAYGGQLYKANATLTSVGEGVTDIGWVFHQLEAAKMPLSQFGTVTPFTTDDVRIILDVANEMNETLPALKGEWDRNNTCSSAPPASTRITCSPGTRSPRTLT
jgi:TRAP-type transport system periplasmic protein